MAQPTEDEIKQEEERVQREVDAAGDKAAVDAKNEGASPEEVQQAVERARKEEKDKLYPQIEELKSSFKEIQKLLKAEQDEKVQMRKDAQDREEAERQAKLSDQERTQEILTRLEEQLKGERKEREKFRKELEDRRAQDELNRYKNTLIEANRDEIIPELVSGNTKEEIDDSLEVAKARFKEYAERFQARQSDTTRRQMPRSTNPDTELLEEQELSKDLTAIDTDKYMKDAAYRAQIQNELENEYSRLAGRR